MSSPGATKDLIERAITRFMEDVPALAPLKLTFGLELRGRGDVQFYKVTLPGPEIARGGEGERVRFSIPRSHFNELAADGGIKQWREAFEHGDAKASGPTEILRLIANVVAKQEERSRMRKAKTH